MHLFFILNFYKPFLIKYALQSFMLQVQVNFHQFSFSEFHFLPYFFPFEIPVHKQVLNPITYRLHLRYNVQKALNIVFRE